MTATYDIRLVILSFCIAFFAAYTALDLAGRIMAARNLARLFWLAGGAAAMGIGIWSMHFIAMLAYQIPFATKAKALQKSEERFRSLFQNVSNIIATVAANGQVNYVSPSITHILGCRPEDWVAENLTKLVHPDDRLVAENLLCYTFENPALDVTTEFRLRHADNCWRDFEVIVKNLLDNPNVAGVVLTCRDITERKQAEADMRKALEKERELNELKSRFISMASHEFRTPLAVVSSSIGILEDYGHLLNPAQSQKQFQHIQKSINYITQLLDDVLMINRADLNGLEFKPAPVNIVQFCQSLVEEMQISAPDYTINLSIIDERQRINRSWFYLSLCLALKTAKYSSQALCAPGLIFNSYTPLSKDLVIRHKIRQHQNRNNPQFDEKLLRRILSNLLSNAVKYSNPGSTIHFKLIWQSESVVFHIQDRGIGIPVEDQALLFESFHRAKNVGRIPGTGLGLAIVRKCVDIHGGEIKVDSHVGIGTTFTVTLPVKQTRKSYETENKPIKHLAVAA
ncbi:MAG: ATP-binding protein [Aulosira sp. DedQUE10]|nr:ATP-binding protein [Aulosira sp. DedQUE10]